MYGLLLESICEALKTKFGEAKWQEIRQKAGVPHHTFATHKTYSETIIPRITRAAHEVTGCPVREIMDVYGKSFVGFVGHYGYDQILRVLGRHMRDFLNGLDNLHEYLRFSYPKMKPPSFFCENESKHGLTLHYRSRRKGYLHYVIGQIRQVGLQFYNTPIDIEVVLEEETLDMTHVVMQLHFDNTAYKDPEDDMFSTVDSIPISSEIFFDVFPFHVVFNQAMIIRSIGCGLDNVMPHIVGQAMDEMFTLTRPMVEFNIENVMMHTNNVFELTSAEPIRRVQGDSTTSLLETDSTSDNTFTMTGLGGCTCTPATQSQESRKYSIASWFEDDDGSDDTRQRLRLKGQMMFMVEWQAVIFLGTPIMENLDKMFETGLYINDLSMHDSSRDLVLAGTQQSAELKLALDQEQQKSKKLEESMRKLDVEMKRTDSLLYQMIPKAVADRLRKGEPAMTTCEVFDQVTILFSDVVGFTRICSQITPMAVVSMLNAMYTKFDKLSEKHRVYKVETIGDAYMVVSGAPIATKFHALYISDMAFDMLESMTDIIDPSTGRNMRIRIGIHSGTVVAGVVGLKMPRYCLFGDTVNTASRMETNGEAMKVHISQTTNEHLKGYPYVTEERGVVEIQGKVMMKTYWLKSKMKNADDAVASALEDSDVDNIGNIAMDNFADIENGQLYSPVTFADLERLKASPLRCPLHLDGHPTDNGTLLTQETKPANDIDSNCLQPGSHLPAVDDLLKPISHLISSSHQISKTTNASAKVVEISPSKETPVYFNNLQEPAKEEKISGLSQRLSGLLN